MRKTHVKEVLIAILIFILSATTVFAEESVQRIGDRRMLNVPLYQQEYNWSCGAASVRMVLKKFGITKSESTLRSALNTTKKGTDFYRMRDYVNSQLGENIYATYGIWDTIFKENTTESINAGYPVICLVKPQCLPNYPRSYAAEAHYIVVYGYILQAGASTQIQMYYNDPHYNDSYYGSYNTDSETMLNAIDECSQWYMSKKESTSNNI